ncbi:ribonuclease H-like protein [Cryphonectria parasitica EP155]|uniref:Ribonuclease H-like protein n=1 Tax=Cryphonectria parasitica (strain ATCC 38755 / EP155) TaxID=660469 RepID=A0A9P4Y0R7_CRYP1|nr:ribonuclease H-like protein [Cryphonectria parasitica EP155]KAF3764872.1 ribonuclease H-like protein [Cryphonectria parasitica EP155]
MASQDDAAPLVWIDCEMTGLDPDKEEIIEIFCLITNGNLDLLDAEGWGTVVHQPRARMDQMDEWCTRTHGESGLTAAVITSEVTPEQAADELLSYIKKYVPDRRVALLAGNSVHADRTFLAKGPYRRVVEHLHYRILDVSSIKEAARRWCPQVAARVPQKKTLHKARDDILESIEEARYYKEAIFQASARGQDGA